MKELCSPKQKVIIALEAIRGLKEPSQLASQYEVHPIKIGLWKKTNLENAQTLFEDKKKSELKEKEELIERLYRAIGQRDIEIEWLKKNSLLTHEARLSFVEKDNPSLGIKRQARLLGISRASVYYAHVVNENDIAIMNSIDEIFTKRPFYGSRRIKEDLKEYGIAICREHVQKLMRVMGLETIYPKRRNVLSDPDHQQKEIPVPVTINRCRVSQPYLGHRHYLRQIGNRLCLPLSPFLTGSPDTRSHGSYLRIWKLSFALRICNED